MLERLSGFLKKLKFKFFGGYDSAAYWKGRHRQYGFDIRGVGNKALSIEENAAQYEQASKVFYELCKGESIDFSKAKILDIGCGIGYYTAIFKNQGTRNYLGLDITDELFPELKKKYPDFTFAKHDVTEKAIEGKYDLVIMIDVTQHITEEQKFKKAMKHIREALSDKGIFIVTSWLDETKVNSYYEKSRSMDSYITCFPGFYFSKPLEFRDKFIFTMHRK